MTMGNFIDIYNKIGPAGVVLVALAIVGFYIAVRNTYYLRLVEKDFHQCFQNIECRDSAYLRNIHHNSNNPLVKIIGEVALIHAQHSQDVRAEVNYMFHRNFEHVSSGITYLRLISVITPLLGLMGTMLGMVDVFQIVATSSVVDSALFAKGIWEALLTTILGLCVAVPALFFYYHLALKIKGFKIEAIEYSYRTIELFNTSCPFGQALSRAKKIAG